MRCRIGMKQQQVMGQVAKGKVGVAKHLQPEAAQEADVGAYSYVNVYIHVLRLRSESWHLIYRVVASRCRPHSKVATDTTDVAVVQMTPVGEGGGGAGWGSFG
jgi:hypothetical protein